MPTAVKMTMEPRTTSGTGCSSRNEKVNKISPAMVRIKPPTRLYCRCAAAERDHSPDGTASDITYSPHSTLLAFPHEEQTGFHWKKQHPLRYKSTTSNPAAQTGQSADADQPERVPA